MVDMAQRLDEGERRHEGVSVPPAGEYAIDADHAEVAFVARHLLSKVRGRFVQVSGSVRVGQDPLDSGVEVTVDTASLTTGSEQRDAHLRSADFFEVEAHPQITFASTAFRPTGGTGFELEGDLTIRGVTRPITLAGEFLGWGTDAYGNDRLFAEARTRVNREDWGLTWNMAVELTGVLVAKEVDLEITVQAARSTNE